MNQLEGNKIIELVDQKRFEEALGISLDAGKSEISKAHITLIKKFSNNNEVKKSISIAKNNLINESIPDKGVRFCNIKKFKEALPYLKQGLKLRGKFIDYKAYGYTLLELGKKGKGTKYLEKAATMSEDPQILKGISLMFWYKGDLKRAFILLKKASKRSDDPEILSFLAMFLIELDRHKEALIALKKLIKIEPTGDNYKLLAANYVKLNQNERALKYFDKAKQLTGDLDKHFEGKSCKEIIKAIKKQNDIKKDE